MMWRLSLFQRYVVAGLLTVLALSLALAGEGTWGAAATYSFFLGAVMLASWIGGLGPGIFSTVLGTAAADNEVEEAVRILKTGGRLVVTADSTLRGNLREIARDDRYVVAESTGPLLGLTR